MKALIIEDEEKNKEILQVFLAQYCSHITVIGWETNVHTAIEFINTSSIDIVFFDIQIGGGTAFDVLANITNKNFESIFITAYDEYAVKAFKFNAIDYLLKPINIDELVIAVDKATKQIQSKLLSGKIDNLLDTLMSKNTATTKIAIPNNLEIEFVALMDILYFQAEGSYTKVVFTNNRKMISTKNIKEYDDLLNTKSFYRIHNAYLINLAYIKKYVRGRGGYVIMDNDEKIEVYDYQT